MPLVIFTNPHAWGQSSEGRLAQEAKWWIKIKHQDIKYVGINLMKYVWNLYILKNNNGEIKEKLNGVFKKIPTREAGWALSPGTGQTCQRAESILKSLCRKQNLTFCCLHSRTFRSISFLVIMVKKKKSNPVITLFEGWCLLPSLSQQLWTQAYEPCIMWRPWEALCCPRKCWLIDFVRNIFMLALFKLIGTVWTSRDVSPGPALATT